MEVLAAIAIGVALGLVGLWFSARSAITICVAEVEKGKLRVTKGGLAPRVLDDVRDVVRRPKIKLATIRVLRAKDRARIEVVGEVSEAQVQQLRNVIGSVPLAKLVNARRA